MMREILLQGLIAHKTPAMSGRLRSCRGFSRLRLLATGRGFMLVFDSELDVLHPSVASTRMVVGQHRHTIASGEPLLRILNERKR